MAEPKKADVLDDQIFDECKKCSEWDGEDCTRHPYKEGCILKPLMGMYGETPRITIGGYEICEFKIPADDTFWIEFIGGKGAQVSKDAFEPVLSEFFKNHM